MRQHARQTTLRPRTPSRVSGTPSVLPPSPCLAARGSSSLAEHRSRQTISHPQTPSHVAGTLSVQPQDRSSIDPEQRDQRRPSAQSTLDHQVSAGYPPLSWLVLSLHLLSISCHCLQPPSIPSRCLNPPSKTSPALRASPTRPHEPGDPSTSAHSSQRAPSLPAPKPPGDLALPSSSCPIRQIGLGLSEREWFLDPRETSF